MQNQIIQDFNYSKYVIPKRALCLECNPYEFDSYYVYQTPRAKTKYGFVLDKDVREGTKHCPDCGAKLLWTRLYKDSSKKTLIAQNQARIDAGLRPIIRAIDEV